MKEALEQTKHLTEKDLQHKSVGDLILSFGEEFGEFCREVKIEDRVYGNSHKQAGDDGSVGEAVDMVIMSLALYFARNKNADPVEDLPKLMKRKLNKWAKNQK